MYIPENVPLFEAIYGTHFISLGNTAGVDLLFSGLTLEGMKAIDLGFGLGGVAYYLASKHQMQILGVEIQPWMIQHAKKQTPKAISHLVNFALYDEKGMIPVEPQSRDLIYSKGVLNHIHDKAPLFQVIHAALKPKGLFVASDWLFTEPNDTKNEPTVLARETKNSYQKLLQEAGFSEIEFRDDSTKYLEFVQILLKNIQEKQNYIEENFGKDLFSEAWKQHIDLIDAINQKQKFATRITARKNQNLGY